MCRRRLRGFYYRRSDWSVHSVLRDEAELNLFSDRYRSRDVKGFFRANFPVMLLTPTCGDDTDDTGGDRESDFFFLKTVASRVNISLLQSDRFRGC